MLTINLTDVQQEAIVVSSSLTASINKYYVNTASSTYTDPTPVQGKGFIVFVRNGTATVGGTGYSTAGTIIFRYYHSGAWANYAISSASTPNLAQVLASDNKTNGLNIISNDGKSIASVLNGNLQIGYYDAVGEAFISCTQAELGGGYNEIGTGENIYFFANATGFQIASATKPVNIDTPVFNFNGAQVATVTDLAGYEPLLGYTPADVNNVPLVEIMTGSLAVFSPADSTTTYIGASTPLAPNATSTIRQLQLPAGTIKSAWLWVDIANTLASTEDVTYYLRNITAGTSTLLGTLTYDARGRANFVTGLSIAVNASDFYSVEIVNPAFATNPTNCYTICKLVIYP
jgi:hypothetical protein